MPGLTTHIETESGVEITLVDAPEHDPESYVRENQRTYSLQRDGTRAAVRVRRDSEGNDGSFHRYVIENLVGGKWHRLLTGDSGIKTSVGFDGMTIDFDAAIQRAAAVLYAPRKES
jgi:hypothetical protein